MIRELAGRKITLIGGAGFIGHHLAIELVTRGADVDIIDSLQVNNLLTVALGDADLSHRKLNRRMINQRLDMLDRSGIPIHAQDARDYHSLSRLLTRLKPDVIVHLAAVAHAGRSNKDPHSTFDHSLRTLENALDWARDEADHFIFMSSSMAYGDFLEEEVEEDHQLDPVDIYGALKVAGEKMVVAYQRVFGLSYTVVRPSALYGPRCVSRRVGQVFIEGALSGSKLRIQGTGDERLDFTYVDDLVDGICLVVQKPEARNQTFNITYGASRSVQEVADIVRQQFDGVEVEYVKRDELAPVRGTLSIKKAQSLLGYAPKHRIEEGFPEYISWYRRIWQAGETRDETALGVSR